MKNLIFLLLFLCNIANADSFARYGVGVFNSAQNSFAETKTLSFGILDRFLPKSNKFGFFVYQFEGGFWIDSSGGEGRKSSLFGSSTAGMRIDGLPFTLSSLHGIGLVSHPDSMLGSVPQFFHDVCLGLLDDFNNANIGMCYKHISNAGIWQPNVGRDFLTIKLQLNL